MVYWQILSFNLLYTTQLMLHVQNSEINSAVLSKSTKLDSMPNVPLHCNITQLIGDWLPMYHYAHRGFVLKGF